MTLGHYLPRLRRSLLSGRRPLRPEPRPRQPHVELLEDRVVPVWSWAPVNAFINGPTNGLAMMLLSDGTAAVQGGSGSPTTTWYRLSPNASGDYANGSWSALGSMNEARRFFTTAMLPDGRIFAVGGEYPKFSNTAEIFDPTANGGAGAWSFVDSVPTPGSQADLFGTVTGATNTAPITITTSATTAALQPGDSVTITGVTGNTKANGTFTISNITPTGFDLNGSDGTMSGAFVPDGKGQWLGPAKSQFGDDPIEVLPGGKVLAGYFGGTSTTPDASTFIFDPSAPAGSQWTKTGTKQDGDPSDEEAWVKLPGNKILSYSIFASGNSGKFKAQIYDPSTGKWSEASDTDTPAPNILEDNGNQGRELGPGFRTPDGNVIYFGANGHTAIYHAATGKWTAGFDEPQKNLTIAPNGSGNYSVTSNPATDKPTFLVGTDDPGAVLPNGHILIALSPEGPMKTKAEGGGYSFPEASFIYEYDPTATTAAAAWIPVPTSGLDFVNAFKLNMLLLPSGQVLMGNEQGEFQIYTEDPTTGPQDAWRPTITGISNNGDGTFTLTGTQLTGLSEGSNYGDDMESNTNYPIVQFRDAAGHIYYGRTKDWSTTDVATGGASEHVTFTLPAGKSRSDVPWISVIANGIANGAPQLMPPGNQTSAEGDAHTFDMGSFSDANGGGPWTVDVDWKDGSTSTFSMSSPGTIPAQSHTYGEEGTYKVTVKVTNTLDGEWDTKTFTVTVNDKALAAGASVPVSAVEGAAFTGTAFATFTDPGGAEPNPSDPGPLASHYKVVSIDWGDGTPPDTSTGTVTFVGTPGSTTDALTVRGSHTYGEEGTSYPITAIIDHEGLRITLTSTATVIDPAVKATGVPVSPVEGATFTAPAATFTDPGGAEPNSFDPGSLDSHYTVVSIDWGDKTPLDTSSGTISYGGAPGSKTDAFTVSGTHTYGEEGTYPITVIIDHEGMKTTVTTTAIVSDPAVLASGVDVSAKEGIAFSLPVATFSDPGGAEPNSFDPDPDISHHYTATVDFGDGKGFSPATITFAGMPGSKTDLFTVTGTHTFDEEGTYGITVIINHEGIKTQVTSTATVRDNYGLLLLDPTGDKSLMVTGQGAVTVNNTGAVVVDSSSPRAIFLAGQAVVTTWEADVGIGGDAVTNGKAVLNLLDPEFNHEAATPDPIALPLPPAPTTHFAAVRYSGSAPLTLSPGTYDGGIAVTGPGPVTLLPGLYYMNGGGFTVSGQGSVTGTGVLIVNAPKASTDVISITGQGSVNLTAPMGLTDPLAAYNGITIMQDPASANPISIVGQGSLTMTGTLYAPAALLKLDGNGNATVSAFFAGHLSLGGVVVAADAMVTGKANLTINADPAPPFQLATGLSSGLTADGGSLLTSRSGLRAGRLLVDVEDSRGAPTPAEQARIDDAIRGLNAALRPFGVDLVQATGAERSMASIRLEIAGTTDFGGTAAGVLGLTENGDAITIVSGWDWYTGADPSAIGPGQYDFETVVAHELGHALGLGEGSDPASVMYPYLASGVARRALSAGDLGVIDSVEGAGRLPAPADAGGGAGSRTGAAPAGSGSRSGPDATTDGADVAALTAIVLGGVPAAPGGAARAALAVEPAAGAMDVAAPQAPVALGGPAVMIWTAVTLVNPTVPADAPAAPPIAVPSPDDGDSDAPRGPVQEGAGLVPAAPAAPAEGAEPSNLPPLETRDACFAAGVRAPAAPQAAIASEDGDGTPSLLAAAGLALGLCAPWRRNDESGRRQPSLK
jgi:hypothetical protein